MEGVGVGKEGVGVGREGVGVGCDHGKEGGCGHDRKGW